MNTILAVGITLIIGLIGANLAHRLKLPSVVGWIIIGVILGPSVLHLYTGKTLSDLGFISDITLALIGFIVGSQITFGTLRRLGGGIISVILGESFGAFIFVFIGVYLLTHDTVKALLFAALAPATAPAGTVNVLEEYKAKGIMSKALYVIVGADDALAIIIYAFAGAYVKTLLTGENLSIIAAVGRPLGEITLAIIMGGAIGWLFGFLARRVRTGDIILPLILGAVFVCIGLSKTMHFSLILANVVLGMVMINTFPKTCVRAYNGVQRFIPPFYICFFALAGAHLNLSLLLKAGSLGLIYIMFRIIGKMIGAPLGAIVGKEPAVIKKYVGFGLFSQAGVAVGLAYLIVREFPAFGGANIASLVITVIAATTVIFQIIGPIGTKFAIAKAGEIRRE